MSTKKILYAVIVILAASCLTLWILLALRWYYNRLELVYTIENEFYTVKQYVDRSRSEHYFSKHKTAWGHNKHDYMIIKCNDKVLMKFWESDCYGESIVRYVNSHIYAIQNDMLIIKRVHHDMYGVGYHAFIYTPLRSGKITNISNVKIKTYRIGNDGRSSNPVPLDSLCYKMHLW